MGLEIGIVRIEDYNSNWQNKFEEEKKNLREIFKDTTVTIEHIGSTSIEGMSAKPIIDIAVGVNKLNDFEKVRNKFINNKEYSVREENTQGEILVIKGTSEYTTHLIHVMEYESERYQNTIIFRDYLRKNLEDKNEYKELKKELAEKYKDDRKMYTASKNNFIQKILKKARDNQNINLRKLNLIVVFNQNLNKVLFCIRAKEPYKGLYNFVGGKVEENESNYEAAYRELFEETGICRNDIELDHFMDLNYFKYENNLQVFYGILKHEVTLVEEKNKLEWVVINDELLNNEKFAGNYNIPHIIRQIKTYLKNGNNIL